MSMLSLAARFALPGRVVAIEPWGDGLINATFRVQTGCALGIMQRLNRAVFPKPALVMANLRRLQDYWQSLPNPGLGLPRLIPTREGKDFLEDAQGECWRMLEYLDGVSLAKVETPEIAEALGRSLGRFHRLLTGASRLAWHEALPGFHRTGSYLAALERARCKEKARSAALSTLFCWIDHQRDLALCLEQERQKGLLPLRVVHGDPKLDNLLFDPKTSLPLAWLDLDTVGPGLVHHDIGDCLRSVCHQAGGFELDLVEPVLAGWWEEVKSLLSAKEASLVPEAIALLPFELGVRFLTDYLEGNRYFKVCDAEENLHRAVEQFALARAVLSQKRALALLWRDLTLRL